MALTVVQSTLRKGTAAEQQAGAVLRDGHQGYALDTNQLKVGDGATAWNSLPIANLADAVATAEQLQDFVGAMVVGGSGCTATYDDGAGTVTIDVP